MKWLRTRHELVLSLMLIACSAAPEQIALPALGPRVEKRTPEFDNPLAGGADATVDESDSGFSTDSCARGQIVATRVAPKVVLVLDGSCSMSTDYPANGAQSASQCTRNERGRWAALRNALVGAQGVVAQLEKAVAFGLVVYGTQPRCPIPGQSVTAELNNLAKIRAAFPEVQPGMYTPTGPALDWVYENMIEVQGPDDRGAAQIVILATDGEPNSCRGTGLGLGRGGASETDYQPSIDAVKRGTNKGAATYVISLADAKGPFHDHLQQLASLGNPAGNEAKLYEPASPDQLAQTLMQLAGAAISCSIQLNGTILLDQACEGTVKLDGVALTCEDPDGWTPIDERSIRLQGRACEQLRASNDASLEADFACTGFRPG